MKKYGPTASRWTQMVDQVRCVFNKDPDKRTDQELEPVEPWLRKRCPIFQNLDKDVMKDILRNCEHRRSLKDEIIVRQGERGDSTASEECFYIILSGTVSVYVDLRFLNEEDGAFSPVKQMKTPEPSKKPMEETERSEAEVLKVHTSTNLAPTPTDGEKSPEKTRSVIGRRKSFDRSKFGKCLTKFEQGMAFGEVALINRDSSRNATYVTDGECDFIVIRQELFERTLKESQERDFNDIVMFIERHPFFCHMTLRLKKILELSLRKETISYDTNIVRQGDKVDGIYFILRGQAKVIVTPSRHRKQYPHLWPFEAAEDLFSIEFEWMRETRRNAILRKYQDPAVIPTKSEDVLIRRNGGYAAIEKKMHQKLVDLCSVQGGEVIGDTEILMGLNTHMHTVRCSSNTEVFFLHSKNFERLIGRRNTTTINEVRDYVLSKLKTRYEMKHGRLVPLLQFLHFKITEQALPEAQTLPPLEVSKTLPSKEIESLHLLQMYKDGKSPLINPLIPGGLYYKELMLEKARERESVRKAKGENIETYHKKTRRGRPQKKPRSLLELRETLRQMMEAELIKVENEKIKESFSSRRTSMSSVFTQSEKSVPQVKQLPPIPPATESETTESEDKSGAQLKNKSAFITQLGKTEKPLPPIQEEKTNEEIQLRKVNDTKNNQRDEMTFEEIMEEEQKKAEEQKLAEFLARQRSENDVFKKFKGSILFDEEEVPTVYTSSSSSGEQTNHPMAAEINDILGDEGELRTLEDKIRSFHIKYCGRTKMHLKLPKLRRYKLAAEEMKIPKPGGKVWIRKRMCQFADKKVQVKDHNHVRYQIVPSLPEFEEVQSARAVGQTVGHGRTQRL